MNHETVINEVLQRFCFSKTLAVIKSVRYSCLTRKVKNTIKIHKWAFYTARVDSCVVSLRYCDKEKWYGHLTIRSVHIIHWQWLYGAKMYPAWILATSLIKFYLYFKCEKERINLNNRRSWISFFISLTLILGSPSRNTITIFFVIKSMEYNFLVKLNLFVAFHIL